MRLLFRTYKHTKKRNLLTLARKILSWVSIFFNIKSTVVFVLDGYVSECKVDL